MPGNINATNRVPRVKNPATIVDVFSAADLPPLVLAPDGTMRSLLAENCNYNVHEAFVWPLILPPPITGFLVPAPTVILGAKDGVTMLFADTSAPAFWSRDHGFLVFRNIILVDVSSGGAGRGVTLFDFAGVGAQSALAPDFVSFVNFKSLGSTVDVGVAFSQATLIGVESGLSMVESPDMGLRFPSLAPLVSQPPGGAPMKKPNFFFRLSGNSTQAQSSGGVANNPGDSFLTIDSSSGGSFSITGMSYPSPASSGDFFRPNVSLALTAMADASKSITAFAADAKAIVAAAPGPGGTIFVTGAVRHQWNVGDTVTHSGMGIGAYDGVKTIAAVFDPFSYLVGGEAFAGTDTGTATNDLATVCASAGAGFTRGQTILVSGGPAAVNGGNTIKSVAPDEDSFILPVDFATVGAGTGTIEITRVTTTSDHPMFVGETQTISGTTSYNFETQILFTVDDDTFDVPLAFVADDATGTVSSVSKTERDIGICLTANGAQRDSKRVASGRVNGNTDATPTANGAYGEIVVTGFVDILTPERFTLVDADAARYEFVGEATTDVTFEATGWATKTGPTANYRYAISIDDAVPVFATAPYSPMEVKSTKVMISHKETVTMSPGQTIQLKNAGDGTADNPTITDFALTLSG